MKKKKKKSKKAKKLKKILKSLGECLLMFVAGFGYVGVVVLFVLLLQKSGGNYSDDQLVLMAVGLTILIPIVLLVLILLIFAGFRLWLAFDDWRRNRLAR